MSTKSLVAVLIVVLIACSWTQSADAAACQHLHPWVATIKLYRQMMSGKKGFEAVQMLSGRGMSGSRAIHAMRRNLGSYTMDNMLCRMEKCLSMGSMDQMHHDSCAMKIAAGVSEMKYKGKVMMKV